MDLLGPAPYARAVKKIGNEMDLALVDLKGVLSPADIGCVSWKGIGKPLPEEILRKTFDACDRLLALHSDYEKVCAFVGSITEYFVPNLCAVFGSEVASKLIVGTAGSHSALANIRADDLSLVGAKKMMDFQRFFGEMPPFCCLGESNLLSGIPGRVRFFAYRYVARSSTVAARVDWKRGDQTGMTGRHIRDEIIGVSERWRKSDPLPIFKPEEGKIDAKVYGVKHAAMGKLGKIQVKKPRKMKWDETSDEIWAKPRKVSE